MFQIWESGWAGSADQGQTWQQITKLNYGHAFVSRVGQKLISRGRGLGQLDVQGSPTLGYVGRSTDNGATWTALQLFDNQGWSSNLLFNGLDKT